MIIATRVDFASSALKKICIKIERTLKSVYTARMLHKTRSFSRAKDELCREKKMKNESRGKSRPERIANEVADRVFFLE